VYSLRQDVRSLLAAAPDAVDSFAARTGWQGGTSLLTARAHVGKVTQSVLAKAFRGELVPTEAELVRREEREYETAEELLARIKGATIASAGHGQHRPVKERRTV